MIDREQRTDREFNYRRHSIAIPIEFRVEQANYTLPNTAISCLFPAMFFGSASPSSISIMIFSDLDFDLGLR